MKTITKKIHYILFKPFSTLSSIPDKEYYFIRVQTEGSDDYYWVIGYENNIDDISIISGVEPSTFEVLDLEKEYKESQAYLKDVINYLKEGRKLQAIKLYKKLTGAGLYEAKEFVLELAKQYPQENVNV